MVRRKKKNQAAVAPATVASLIRAVQQLSVQQPARTTQRRRRRRGPAQLGPSQEGAITLMRRELVETVTIPAQSADSKGTFKLIPEAFSFLKSISKSFDRIIWSKIQVYYKPAVGSAYGGLVSYGMDWDFGTTSPDRSSIAALTPSSTTAAWADTEKSPLTLPVSRLQSKKSYNPSATSPDDRGPGQIHWAVSGTRSNNAQTIGEIWIYYSATMMGTNPA